MKTMVMGILAALAPAVPAPASAGQKPDGPVSSEDMRACLQVGVRVTRPGDNVGVTVFHDTTARYLPGYNVTLSRDDGSPPRYAKWSPSLGRVYVSGGIRKVVVRVERRDGIIYFDNVAQPQCRGF